MFRYFRAVNESIKLYTDSEQQRQALFMIAVGNALATDLTIPVNKVGDSISYFNENHRDLVKAQISSLNEKRVVSTEQLFYLVRELWTLRYRIIHYSNHPDVQRLLCQHHYTNPTVVEEGYQATVIGLDSEAMRRFNTMAIESFGGDNV